jgi:GrpB-like predicted nucleotidyltransferase (UPF0157 family)
MAELPISDQDAVKIERMAVELVPNTQNWAGRVATEEARRLKEAVGDTLVVVHHIGSTSIPDILAKPTVDLLPLVRDLASLDAREAAVRALGYEWRGEFGLPGRRYCKKDDPQTGKRLFNVHFYQFDSPEVTRHLAFRDYLRAHPKIAKAYEAEKVRAATLQPDDVLLYNDEKNDWIKRVEADAIAWTAQR